MYLYRIFPNKVFDTKERIIKEEEKAKTSKINKELNIRIRKSYSVFYRTNKPCSSILVFQCSPHETCIIRGIRNRKCARFTKLRSHGTQTHPHATEKKRYECLHNAITKVHLECMKRRKSLAAVCL